MISHLHQSRLFIINFVLESSIINVDKKLLYLYKLEILFTKMVKTWIESEDEIRRTGSIIEAGLAGIEALEGVPTRYEETPLSELRNYPPSKFVKTKQRWCVNFVAESYSYADVSKEKIKNSFIKVQEAIIKNAGNKPFDVKDVVTWVGATDLSDGMLQRKILSWMVCLGILRMNHILIKDKNGKDKPKYVFIQNTSISKCPQLSNGKCTFDWKNAAVTDYFPPEYRQSSDTESHQHQF